MLVRMKHCYTIIAFSDTTTTELECALCHQAEKEAGSSTCPYDQTVDVRSDIRVVNHLVMNGWDLHTVLAKDAGLAYVLVKKRA